MRTHSGILALSLEKSEPGRLDRIEFLDQFSIHVPEASQKVAFQSLLSGLPQNVRDWQRQPFSSRFLSDANW
jgi:hypothetical protein